MSSRFRDTGRRIGDFSDRVLVYCPRCDRRAEVSSVPIEPRATGARRCVCGACGYNGDVEPAQQWSDLRLWLQAPCCGEILWAYNEAHLAFLESYIQATLREGFAGNGTLASRLPTWIKSGRHREELVQCTAKLRARLAER